MSQTASPAASKEPLTPDICVIGDTPGGLAVATAAALLGVRTMLIRQSGNAFSVNEGARGQALRAAAERVRASAGAQAFGIAAAGEVDYGRVRAHLDQVSARLAANDSDERLAALGVLVLKGEARFQNRHQIALGETVIKARRFVVATGSLPAIPDIAGLAELPSLTEDSIFDLAKRPERLIVLGGTTAAVELAQAMRALGSEVALIAREGLLPDEDPEAVGVLRRAVLGDGIALHEGRPILRAESYRQRPRLVLDGEIRIDGTHLLVASGRTPNIAGLELDLAGVRSDDTGIIVDASLRTANRSIYAVGGCAGGAAARSMSSQAAQHQAGLVLRNALFRQPTRFRHEWVPRTVHGRPELASVGLNEAQARAQGEIRVLRFPYAESSRAQAERQSEGLIKLMTNRKGGILGVVIAGAQAAELIVPWSLAVQKRMNVTEMAGLIAPSQSLSELSQKAALSFQAPLAGKPGIRRLIGFLSRFG
ncbi:Pyruvate/2-oxoglutarate dehydrogenase complex, dihydrolipoamide dehydrogenase (E3) component [Bosea sp. 62]|uniref:dihydrolipoyl dehydrogenase family protein n=1 Tax=unclassified Bosea (in: a-proteobacteria) TaxID=2653178 RepID=UPI0012543FDE|nr:MULTISPECIES: NAD(P)/FAD-dependent oxidoreductase [unclassified Bosea (in: a-proteobacteria)]CAD5296367.1 Pyruvate/2-oxoglutarate dehydrogenase complex, dihydrolipoamide dehydrogenase (E3) component [Bosea sp. 21B]CAD5296751.1 Pyruvate/2-oxoglutarate dehydrogenase complex, dihydrolipoamide dehydrogenase (E3) component [Bosea sp. 46]CAD5297370.1 Pyruvate/2-oxoglutarate dehydrogenase complex, dihydrolipoamide dehydrogenase (E3) component [Bosea sp. 7B]VVT61131.1 Pyruvate/2-oxoglutarate dehydro